MDRHLFADISPQQQTKLNRIREPKKIVPLANCLIKVGSKQIVFSSRLSRKKYPITKLIKKKIMTRVKRGIVARKRRKKILSITSGFRGAASVLFRTANQRYMKALRSAYQNRRQKKRDFRRLWISRLNAAVRTNGLNYNEFIHALKTCNIVLDRQTLSQLSICDSNSFTVLFEKLLPNLILSLSRGKKDSV